MDGEFVWKVVKRFLSRRSLPLLLSSCGRLTSITDGEFVWKVVKRFLRRSLPLLLSSCGRLTGSHGWRVCMGGCKMFLSRRSLPLLLSSCGRLTGVTYGEFVWEAIKCF
jgi:hypothetical protein